RPDDHEPLTATGQVMGTAHYLAPELARGRAATAASDIYALGVVAYECLAGRRPFEGDDQIGVATAHLSEEPPPLPETISPDVRALVAAAMEKDPLRRIGGADVLAAAAESLRLHLHGAGPGTNGMPVNGAGTPGTAPTVFGVGAAAAAGAAAAEAFGPHGPVGSPPFGPLQSPPSGAGGYAATTPPPGAATASGALLGADGGPGSPDSGYPGVYQRPPTAPLPIVDDPGSGGLGAAGRRARSVSLPMIALVGLVAAVVIGTLVVALSQRGANDSGGTSTVQNTPTPTNTRRTTRSSPSPSKSTPPVIGGTTQTQGPSSSRGTPSQSRTTKPTPSPTRTSSPSPTATTKPSPSPTPVASGTTSPSPVDSTPSPSGQGGDGGGNGADTALARAGSR
ncbi:MAG TPA: protein kinase, partial [Kineosporiaceae bacterium]|nr:protein kinase [Kineosporiaceae bacterium]